MYAKSVEIEARCRVKNPVAFLKALHSLDSAAVFPGMHGGVRELNLIYLDAKHPETTIRLRRRIFPDQITECSYTEKGKNQSNALRVKKEKTTALNEIEFRSRVRSYEYQYMRTFVYERTFDARHYQVFKGVEIEHFLFPFLGFYAEFELCWGSEKDLKKVMSIFGYRFRDNIQESTKEMARGLFLKKGEAPVMGIIFSRKEWSDFCQEYGAKFGTNIKFVDE